jgi:two-component system OmpR family response regulator
MIDRNPVETDMPVSPVSLVHDAPPRILVIEDDASIAGDVRAELTGYGYMVHHHGNGTEALHAIQTDPFDLLIVDRMLPGLDGLTLVERVRAQGIRTPVLMLSALSAVDERVRGLKAGGDDYLGKPFAFAELAARVEALLRRPTDSRETVLRLGKLHLDLIDRVATRNGRSLDLLPREFKLLEYLVRRAGQVVTRDMLLEDVWRYRNLPQTNLVDVHIGRLRRKLDPPDETPMIYSVRGAGFILRVPD